MSKHVVEIPPSDFQSAVLEESSRRPVMVDFWAAWCGPCRALGPVLETLAADYDGAFVLAKVDTEANPELAAQFGIRGIPAVKLLRDGEVVDEFVGALPADAVRAFLDRHVQSKTGAALATAQESADAGDFDGAMEQLDAIVDARPDDPAVRLVASRVAFSAREYSTVARHVDAIAPLADEKDLARSFAAAATLASDSQDLRQCQQRCRDNPNDVAARFDLGTALLADGQFRASLDAYLTVVGADRRYRDDGARKAILTIFNICGDAALAREFRRKLMLLV